MRTMQSALLRGSGLAAALTLPSQALAPAGDENWGEMLWGLPVSVPSLPGIGLIALAFALSATAAWTLRKRRPGLGLPVLLVLLAIPLVVAAGTLTVPNTFTNGKVADADEVNANFDAVETEVNDNDSRITVVESETATAQTAADAAQGTADTAVADAAAAQLSAVAAQSSAESTPASGPARAPPRPSPGPSAAASASSAIISRE